MSKIKHINEILLGLYLFLFTFVKLFIYFIPGYSFLFLAIPTVLVLLYSFLFCRTNKVITVKKNVITISLFMFVLFLVSILFHNNKYVLQHLYEFVIYGVIVMYLFSKITDYNYFMMLMANLSILNFLLFFGDGFNGYKFFGDYMSYGLECMLPILCYTAYSRKINFKKRYLVIEILSFMVLAIYCNRGALLTAAFFELSLFFLTLKKNNRDFKIVIKIIFAIFVFIILFLSIDEIILNVINFLNRNGIDSYAFKSFYQMLTSDYNGLSGRDSIWQNAIAFIFQNPTFGSGIGSFEQMYGVYTHNLFLDVTTSFGLVGMVILLIILYKFFKNFLDTNQKTFYLFIAVIGLLPLMLSIHLYRWPYFWIAAYMGFTKIGGAKDEKAIDKNFKIS